MEVLSSVKHATVSEHIKNILTSGELNGASVGFSDKNLNGRKKKASGKSSEFKLLLKMMEREKYSQKSSDCLRPTSHPSSHPSSHPQDTPQDLDQRLVELIEFCGMPCSKREMLDYLGLTDSKNFRERYLVPLLNAGKIEMTIPDKPSSRRQKYKKVNSDV